MMIRRFSSTSSDFLRWGLTSQSLEALRTVTCVQASNLAVSFVQWNTNFEVLNSGTVFLELPSSLRQTVYLEKVQSAAKVIGSSDLFIHERPFRNSSRKSSAHSNEQFTKTAVLRSMFFNTLTPSVVVEANRLLPKFDTTTRVPFFKDLAYSRDVVLPHLELAQCKKAKELDRCVRTLSNLPADSLIDFAKVTTLTRAFVIGHAFVAFRHRVLKNQEMLEEDVP